MVITMKDEIYEYLISYGFNKDNLNKFEEENENMYFVSLNKVKENIDFFTNKGLNKSEFINIVNVNPFILTLSSKRKSAFDDIYINKLNLSNEEIKYLLNANHSIYTCSPIELDKIINYLIKEKNYSIDNIKKLLLYSPSVINKNLDDIIGMI